VKPLVLPTPGFPSASFSEPMPQVLPHLLLVVFTVALSITSVRAVPVQKYDVNPTVSVAGPMYVLPDM
jgi:hypothetical protein